MASRVRTQVSRPRWNYNATMQFWKRMFDVMFHDAQQVNPDGTPTDDALSARAWFAWSEPDVSEDGEREFASWPEVCHWLGKDWDIETAAALEKIDAAADFDTPECTRRLKALAAMPVEEESVFELPEWARVVPALDQLSMLEAGQAVKVKTPKADRGQIPAAVVALTLDQLSIFGMVN